MTTVTPTECCKHCAVPLNDPARTSQHETDGVCAFCADYTPPATSAQQLDVLVNRIDIVRHDGNEILQALPGDAPLFAVADITVALCHLRRAAVLLDKANDQLEADAAGGDPMTPKKKIVTEVVDLDPVDLDPPDPAIARWEEFAARDIDIEHDGDAEKVIPFPRPAWADPSRDDVCATSQGSSYRSPKVLVASLTAGGCDDGGWLEPASAEVSARVHGNGNRLVGLTIRRYVNEEWREFGMSMPPSAAVELADVLRAAVDLFGSGQ